VLGFLPRIKTHLSIVAQWAKKGRGYPGIAKLRKHQPQSNYLYMKRGHDSDLCDWSCVKEEKGERQ